MSLLKELGWQFWTREIVPTSWWICQELPGTEAKLISKISSWKILMDGKGLFWWLLGYKMIIQRKPQPLILGFKLFWNLRGVDSGEDTEDFWQKIPKNATGSTFFTNTLRWSPQIWQRWLPNKHMHAGPMQTRGNVKNLYQDGPLLLRPLQMECPYEWPYKWGTVLVSVSPYKWSYIRTYTLR